MTGFQDALARFLNGQLDQPGLETALRGALRDNPADAERIIRWLDQLFRSSRLPAQLYIALKQQIEESAVDGTQGISEPARGSDVPGAHGSNEPGAGRGVSAPPDHFDSGPAPTETTDSIAGLPEAGRRDPGPPPLRPEADLANATGSGSDILDILGMPEAVSPAEPPAGGGAGPADDPGSGASEDKTVFRQAAPARVRPPGEGIEQPTGQTGQTGATGQTGQTGATGGLSGPTGTGSSWTDPSKWGEGPAPVMQPGSILKDRYVLETVIGRGGMGVVFKAKDLRREEAQDRNPHIAVKILNDEFRRHPESLKALQRESRKAQDLAHPNIVTVFDFDRDGQTVYMTMEYLEGQSLDRITKDATFDGMPLEEAYPLIAGLGRALAYAHDKGVVHSDFKPANAFLTNDGTIKVFDFGIARAAKLPGDRSGEMTLFDPGSLGALTPAYASCEMIDGEEPDPRDDIYALACLAYELLTGRHPFDKRSATEARDKGLNAQPVKGLSRRNWRGLQQGLAFRREDRSSTVNQFLDDLKVRELKRTSIAISAVATVAAIVLIATFVPPYLDNLRIERMVTAIVQGDDRQVPGYLEELAGFGPEARNMIIQTSEVEDRLINYFVSAIENAQDGLDYLRAEALLAEAQALYDDSNRLAVAGENLEFEKDNLLEELDNRFNANLEAGRLLPSDGEDITKVLSVYERIAPGHPALTDPQLAIAYANLADRLLQEDLAQADLALAEGRRRFPEDARLIGLQDRLNTLREFQDREARVAELNAQLTNALASISSLEDFAAISRDLQTLEALEPDSRIVARLRERLETLADASIASALEDNQWIQARNLLAAHAGLLTPEFRSSALQRIDAAETQYQERIGGVLAGIRDAVQSGNIERAANRLAGLGDLNTDPEILRQARQIVSRGYLSAAQSARAAGRLDEARDLVAAGRSVDPMGAGWQAELDAIADAQRVEAEGLAEQAQAERLARIDALRNRIQGSLDQSPFDIETAKATLASIDELSRLDPAANLAREGRSEVAAKLATEARGVGFRDQNFDEALALVAASIDLLPADPLLLRAQSELQTERQRYLVRAAEAQATELRAELERLIASPQYDAAWEANLRRAVQGLEPLGDQSYLGDRRDRIATLYLERARALRSEERFDLADRMLTSSEWFAPDSRAARQERDLLAKARSVFEEANRERQQAAQIEGLKRTFATELNAERVPDARNTLSSLQKLLPSGDAFLTTEAPRAIANAYERIASRSLAEKSFDRAEQFALLGLKEVPDHSGLTKLLAEIVPQRLAGNLAALRETLRSAEPQDAITPSKLLGQIRADAGTDYPKYEAELLDIARQRITNSKSNRDAVVAWVSKILPGFEAPPMQGPPCAPKLAGFGSRGRGQCYDFLPGASEEGPRLVVVPAGGGVSRPYAISRQEVSIGEWNAYCRLSKNCQPRNGQNELYPITNIRIEEAKAYATWLSSVTKYTYRLPTDLEWEHAAKAQGTSSISPNCINQQAGLLGDTLLEVNRGGQNSWGLMNYVGNAQEWVIGPSGDFRARGGAFNDRLGTCAIELSRTHTGAADEFTGFRLVRELGEDA